MSRRNESQEPDRNPLPTERDFDPYGGGLDEQCAWKHFGGLTLDEANAKFRECPETYQEDFMFMGSKAFAYYFPVIDSYLGETQAYTDYDDRQAWILAHALLSQCASQDLQPLFGRILELARFVRQNIHLFAAEPTNQHRIEAVWQKLEDFIGSKTSE